MSEPILICAFNRPASLRRIIDVLRVTKPDQLFISVDGPRVANAHDRRAIEQVSRELERVDWPCRVRTRFLLDNLGVSAAVHSAISWFFDQVPRGIILEEDCLPTPSFFDFCSTVLSAFQNDRRVWLGCGTNHLVEWRSDEVDVFFSEGHIWGWMTWADRWESASLAVVRDNDTQLLSAKTYFGRNWRYRRKLILLARARKIDSWAVPWLLVVAKNNGLCALPARNLVTNIGHARDASHTRGSSRFANLPPDGAGMTFTRFAEVEMDRQFQDRWAVLIWREHLYQRGGNLIKSFVRRLPPRLPAARTSGQRSD